MKLLVFTQPDAQAQRRR